MTTPFSHLNLAQASLAILLIVAGSQAYIGWALQAADYTVHQTSAILIQALAIFIKTWGFWIPVVRKYSVRQSVHF